MPRWAYETWKFLFRSRNERLLRLWCVDAVRAHFHRLNRRSQDGDCIAIIYSNDFARDGRRASDGDRKQKNEEAHQERARAL